jgi:hypothetical protein
MPKTSEDDLRLYLLSAIEWSPCIVSSNLPEGSRRRRRVYRRHNAMIEDIEALVAGLKFESLSDGYRLLQVQIYIVLADLANSVDMGWEYPQIVGPNWSADVVSKFAVLNHCP